MYFYFKIKKKYLIIRQEKMCITFDTRDNIKNFEPCIYLNAPN